MTRAHTKQFERAVADCVVSSVPGYAVGAPRESPDADLVHEDGHHVGLEVVSIVDRRYPETRNRIAEAAGLIEAAMRAEGLRGRVSIYFDVDALIAGRSNRYRAWLRALPRAVVEYVRGRTHERGRAEQDALVAAGIERVGAIEWEPSESTSVHRGARLQTAPRSTVVELCLAKKDALLAGYRAAGDYFREHWLAIESLGPGTVEDGGFTMLLSRRYTSDFDRVFLIIRDENGRFARAQDVTPKRAV